MHSSTGTANCIHWMPAKRHLSERVTLLCLRQHNECFNLEFAQRVAVILGN